MDSLTRPPDDAYDLLTPEIERLARRGHVESYAPKTLLIQEGAEESGVFVLMRGRVKVFSLANNGREITYDVLSSGDFFGEMSLDGGPRSASVVTVDACTCSLLSRADIDAHLQAEPSFAIKLVVYAIRRARAATEIARKMALMDVYGRLVAVLEGESGLPVIAAAERLDLDNTTHREIASRVGASREMVSRLLKDLEKGGYIQMGTRQVVLLRKLPPRW